MTFILKTGRVVISNVAIRPPSFAISSSGSSSRTDILDSPGLLTNGSWIHSFPDRGSFVVGR